MKMDELLTVNSINYANFDFEKCEKKEILTQMLENLTPIQVEKFNSKGTYWNLLGAYYAEFDLYINGALLGTSDLTDDFIKDLLNFLPHLACADDKKLICPFEYEGIVTAFVVIPMEEDKIRVSVFADSNLYKIYRSEYKFNTDIVINKNTFIKQMYEILKNVAEDTLKDNEELDNYWVNRINYTLSELDKYFENPEKYKKKYEFERYIRVFDVAYKDLDGNWKFIIALDGEQNANHIHWESEKQKGNILNYDIFEQYPANIFQWDRESKSLKKLSKDEIKQNIKNNMDKREEDNWVYSGETQKWYAPNEIMPYRDDLGVRCIHCGMNYEIIIEELYTQNEDEELENFIEGSYNIDGELLEDDLGYMDCKLILKSDTSTFAKINFDYRNYKEIRESLLKVKNGEYARFTLDGNNTYKLHIWQYLYDNSESTDSRDLMVACYNLDNYKELYSFIVDKKEFINCFTHALDDIEHKLEVTKHLMEVGEKLQIKEKFSNGNRFNNEYNYIENFKGDYACVYNDSLDGWGIIDKNFKWVMSPKSATIYGEEHPKYGVEIRGFILGYYYLHNVDGELFIAAKHDKKRFVMDIKGDIKIPHVSDKVYYTYFNNELYFVFADEDKTIITNKQGDDILTLDFEVGEKFWLFDDIIIVSKNNKFGIIDWKGNIIIDFIFSEINPDKDNLDFIPVKYINMWGFINKSGEIIDMKIKE